MVHEDDSVVQSPSYRHVHEGSSRSPNGSPVLPRPLRGAVCVLYSVYLTGWISSTTPTKVNTYLISALALPLGPCLQRRLRIYRPTLGGRCDDEGQAERPTRRMALTSFKSRIIGQCFQSIALDFRQDERSSLRTKDGGRCVHGVGVSDHRLRVLRPGRTTQPEKAPGPGNALGRRHGQRRSRCSWADPPGCRITPAADPPRRPGALTRSRLPHSKASLLCRQALAHYVDLFYKTTAHYSNYVET